VNRPSPIPKVNITSTTSRNGSRINVHRVGLERARVGFANAGERNRLEAALCEQADERLFQALKYNPIHPLHTT